MSNIAQFPVLQTTPEPTIAERRRAMRVASTIVMPASLLSAAPAGLIKRIGRVIASKLGLMVFVSVITQFIIKPDAFWHFLKLICAIIGMAGDEKVTKGISTLLQNGKEVVKQQTQPGDSHDGEKPKPTLGERARNFGAKVKDDTKEAVEETRQKVEDKTKPLAQKAEKAFERLGGEGSAPPLDPQKLVAVAPPGTSQQLVAGGVTAPPPGIVASPTMVDRAKAGARGFGNGVAQLGSSISAGQSYAVEERRQYEEWWAKNCPFNGQCPRHHGMKIPSHAKSKHLCSICNCAYPAQTIFQMGPPAPPAHKPRQFYQWRDQQLKEAEHKEMP